MTLLFWFFFFSNVQTVKQSWCGVARFHHNRGCLKLTTMSRVKSVPKPRNAKQCRIKAKREHQETEQHPLAETMAWNQVLVNSPSGGKNYFPASCANLKLFPKEAKRPWSTTSGGLIKVMKKKRSKRTQVRVLFIIMWTQARRSWIPAPAKYIHVWSPKLITDNLSVFQRIYSTRTGRWTRTEGQGLSAHGSYTFRHDRRALG